MRGAAHLDASCTVMIWVARAVAPNWRKLVVGLHEDVEKPACDAIMRGEFATPAVTIT